MKSNLNTGNQKNKLLGLEIIRFLSAVAILIWHYQHFSFVADKPENFNRELQPYYSILNPFYNYGGASVQIFWCLSGFIFFWKYRNKISSGAIDLTNFLVRRFSRLYPLHFVALMLVLIMQVLYYVNAGYYFVYQNNDVTRFILHLFLASNWWGLEIGNSFNGPIWSISVEVLAYFIFFLVLKLSKSITVNLFILVLSMVAMKLKVPSQLFNCLAFFYIGGMSAIVFEYIEDRPSARRIFRTLLVSLFLWPFVIYNTTIYDHKYFATLFLMTYTPLLLIVSAQRVSVPPVIQKMIGSAGNMTYAMYLIHFPLQLSIATYYIMLNKEIPYYNASFFLGYMSFILFLSFYTYKLFEVPIQNKIRKKYL